MTSAPRGPGPEKHSQRSVARLSRHMGVDADSAPTLRGTGVNVQCYGNW